jgi:CBS domain containing-hemolysin-like protein
MDTVLGLAAVFVLVFINGFFVAAEFSLVGARRTRIAQLASEGNVGALAAEKAIKHIDSYIAATQLGITLASLALGWIGEPAVGHLFEPLVRLLPADIADTIGHTLSAVIAFALVTMLTIALGELTPKSIALQRPEGTAIIVARPVTWFLRLFRPVITSLNWIGNSVVRLLGFQPQGEYTQVHSPEELEMLVKSSGEAGLLPKSEVQILRRAFDFSEIPAEEIMQPRVEVFAIDIETPLPELCKLIAAEHYSRYPAYEGSIDNVIGVLHTKDLLDLLVQKPQLLTDPTVKFDLRPILRTPIFVPGTTGVDKLLERMQRTKTHLAVILDEYGGMAGVATMEDVLEELVGEIRDEFDSETSKIVAREDFSVVDGLVSLSDVIERFGKPGGEPQSTTIGGYVPECLGRIPTVGDTVPFGSYDLRVEEMDGLRVAKVRFTKRVSKPAADTPPADR